MTTEAGAASRSVVLSRPLIVTSFVASILPLALSKPPLIVRVSLVLSVPLLTNVPLSATSRPTLSVRLERLLVSLPEAFSSAPLLIVILSLPWPWPLIVTLPSAFLKSLSNFWAQASFQVCSFWTVPATVCSVKFSAVPTVSVTSLLTGSAMAPAEKTASVVRTAATSGFLEKVALLIDLSFVDDPGVVHEWQIPARIPKTGVGKSASLGAP